MKEYLIPNELAGKHCFYFGLTHTIAREHLVVLCDVVVSMFQVLILIRFLIINVLF